MAIGADSSSLKAPIEQNWVVLERPWEKVLKEAGIDPTFALKQLETQNIFVSFGEPSNLAKTQGYCYFENRNQTLLKDYGETQVYYPSHPMTLQHLCVQLVRRIDHFNDVSEEEAIELQRTANKVISLLRDEFGIASAIIASYNRPQEPGKVSLEILAPISEEQIAFDEAQKIHDNNYIFFRKYSSLGPSKEEREKVGSIWKKIFLESPERSEFSSSEENEPFFPSLIVSRNGDVAECLRADLFADALIERGVPLERSAEKTVLQHPVSENISTLKESCAFCSKKVIDAQKIFETPLFNLIVNFNSMKNQLNFLLVSKRHIRNSTQLNPEEIVDLHRIKQLFLKVLEENCSESRIVMVIQEGASVGQTVPHLHMHIIPDPNDLRFPLHYMNYCRQKKMTPEEMRPIIQDLSIKLLAK